MKIFKTRVKMPTGTLWLVPGLRLKRWFILIIAGSILAAIGVTLMFKLEPIYFIVKYARTLFHTPALSYTIGAALIFAGAYIFVKAWQETNFSMLDVSGKRSRKAMGEALYRRMKLNHGAKIVAIGGGTGLSTLLKGIKRLTNNITAIVTVGDDGGSSGRLREEMGILPPGDIRNCIAALADDDDIVTKLFQYRFKSGEGLEGHSFGNLFITAMTSICGDMVSAIRESSKVLLIRGRVLPATTDDMRLSAKMADGTIVKGESNIPEAHKRIVELSCEPSVCRPTKDVLDSIHNADLIILGPGSLYTSITPNLLVDGVSEAVANSKAAKIYVCNVMTQPGETDNYTVSDHIKALLDHSIKHGAKNPLFNAVLVNDFIPFELAQKYEEKGSLPVIEDTQKIEEMGIEVVRARLIQENKEGLVRHNPALVAKAIYLWYRKKERNN